MALIPDRLKKKIKNSICKNNPRHEILDLSMDFCLYNKIEGDYFEFGVWKGDTFQYAFNAAQKRDIQNMRFCAFDSFEGFSQPMHSDDIGLIKKHDRTCSVEDFKKNIIKHGVGLDKVSIVPGWFSDVLNDKAKEKIISVSKNKKAAIVYMDCDLYEPSICALDFITNFITDGTVLIFDNWFYFRGNPKKGERKAFYEWSQKNKNKIVTDFYNFGWHGHSFIINL